jgi:hypothetical protein
MDTNPSAMITRTKPQRIVIIIGNLQNLQIPSQGAKCTIENIKESLLIFCLSKFQMTSEHKYSFITSSNQFIKFLSNTDEIRDAISKISVNDTDLEIVSLLSRLETELEIIPDKELPFVVQIIMVLGESPIGHPIFHRILSHRDVYLDILYVPEIEESNTNVLLQTQTELNEECYNKCYYFNLKKDQHEIYKSISLLTAHPQQRIQQNDIESYLNKFSSKRRK